MSIFNNAQALEVNDGTFIATAITNNYPGGPTGIDILREASTPEAAHDSSARAYSPRCFPGTREQYIQDIVHWAIPALSDTPPPIYWMKGPPGVGKSAIAQTCVEKLQKMGGLGAAFFFSINGRSRPEKFFPSIAYQLSTIHPAYRELVDAKIRHDRTLVDKAMPFQFRYLIDEPLWELEQNGKGIRAGIQVFVDGLDECEGSGAQCEIIRIIAAAASNGVLPLRWAFFSRPEPHIEAMFSRPTIAPQCYKTTLPISHDSSGEIELYLRNGFGNILQHRNISLQFQWPSPDEMKIVVGAADGSFIYATTVLRFVGHTAPPGPQQRFRAIVDAILNRRKRNSLNGTNSDSPFAELDAFYMLILERIPRNIFSSVHLLLALICRWGGRSAIATANSLGLPKEEFENVCNHANAVVHLVNTGDDLKLDPTIDTSVTYMQTSQCVLTTISRRVVVNLGGQVSFYHKSFEDFLLDPARSGSFCVALSDELGKRFLQVHLEYERSFCWHGSELTLAPGVPDSAASLSYPYTTELVNSVIKGWVYSITGRGDAEGTPMPGDNGWLNIDFRKHLYVRTRLLGATGSAPGNGLLWGCECRTKSSPGCRITWISGENSLNFRVADFKLMIKQYQRARIIKRYHPNLTSRLKSLLCHKSNNHVESGLYRMGHHVKSIFWYWEINHELEYYREFRAVDLAEGEKKFEEGDFDFLRDYGRGAEPEAKPESVPAREGD